MYVQDSDCLVSHLKQITVTYFSWFSDFAFYLEVYLMYKCDIFWSWTSMDIRLTLKLK